MSTSGSDGVRGRVSTPQLIKMRRIEKWQRELRLILGQKRELRN
jgi:hypothetical protein